MAVSAELLRDSTATTAPREGGPVRHADDEWITRLFVDYEPRVRRFVHGFTRPDHVVDDVVQEVFIRAHRVRDEFPEGDPWPLLVTIARRASIDMHRRRAVRSECPTKPEILEGRRVSIGDLVGGPESLAVPTGRAAHVAEALDRMDPRYRRILVLKHVAGFKYQELADAEGLSLDGIKCALRRARHSFKQTYLALVRSRGFEAVFGPVLVPIARRLRTIRNRVAASPAVQGALNALTSASALANSMVAVAGVAAAALGGMVFVSPAAADPADARPSASVVAVADAPTQGWKGHVKVQPVAGADTTTEAVPAASIDVSSRNNATSSPAAASSPSSGGASAHVDSDDVVPVEDPPAGAHGTVGAGSDGAGASVGWSLDRDPSKDGAETESVTVVSVTCPPPEERGAVKSVACPLLEPKPTSGSGAPSPDSGEPLPELPAAA